MTTTSTRCANEPVETTFVTWFTFPKTIERRFIPNRTRLAVVTYKSHNPVVVLDVFADRHHRFHASAIAISSIADYSQAELLSVQWPLFVSKEIRYFSEKRNVFAVKCVLNFYTANLRTCRFEMPRVWFGVAIGVLYPEANH